MAAGIDGQNVEQPGSASDYERANRIGVEARHVCLHIQSCRNALTGSTRAARLAGTKAATTAVALTDSQDQAAALDARARSYLHSNCANCHRPNGTTQSTMDLRFSTAFGQMNICNVDPQQGNLGINQAKLLAPRDPTRSILLERISRNDQNRMPPVGSNILDSDAITLLTDWINSIQACP